MYEYIDAEESLISCLMSRLSCMEDIYGMLSPDMFDSGICGAMFLEYAKSYDEKKEITLTELHQAVAAAGYQDSDITEAIKNCVGRRAMAFQVKGYATTISNHYKKTCVDKLIERTVIQDATVDEQIDKLISDLETFQNGEVSLVQTVAEIADELKDKYFVDKEKPSAKVGLEDIDDMIGGFDGGDLVILGARPAVGKSAFVTQWAESLAKQGLKVGFYNLEMTTKQMFERFVAAKSGIEVTRIRLATNYLGEEKERYEGAVAELMKQNRIYISTGAKKVGEIRVDMRKMKYDVVIVDYLQLLVADDRYKGNRQAEVGYISAQLKRLAMDFQIPVIALSQLNRASEARQTKEPTMGELREAGNLEQDASTILLMWNNDETDKSKKSLKVEKSRQGKTGVVDLVFDGAHMKFKTEKETPFG